MLKNLENEHNTLFENYSAFVKESMAIEKKILSLPDPIDPVCLDMLMVSPKSNIKD